jgi:hypothetical protein
MDKKYLKNLVTVAYAIIVVAATAGIATSQVPSYEQLAKIASWGPNVHAFQLGIVPPHMPYRTGNEMSLTVLIRNNGPQLSIVPPGDYMFETALVDGHGERVRPSSGGLLNTSGAPSEGVASGAILKRTLYVDQRYSNLGRGTYRLTVSTNIYEGSSFPARALPVYAHVTSPPITITVL